jgi:hypothetical protein
MKKLFIILVSLLVTASVYSQTYEVNKFYPELGGYVIKTDGTNGVVVAMQDQGAANWYDTEAMVNDASKHDANGAKFNDWRLPTIDELKLVYLLKQSIGGFIDTIYWSSSWDAYGAVWNLQFGGNGNLPDNESPINVFNVRAVRAF